VSQNGYTLAETMAALVMIGLAIGGLGQATFLIGRLNRAAGADIAAGQRLGAAQRALDGLLSHAGPFHPDDDAGFSGQARSLAFPCGDGGICGAELAPGRDQTALIVRRKGRAVAARPLGAVPNIRFVYRDAAGAHDTWPAGESLVDGAKLTLETVSVVSGRGDPGEPLAVSRLWARQAAACQFDAIAGDCRKISP